MTRHAWPAACLLLLGLGLGAAASELSLARELADEGDGAACVVECLRVERLYPAHAAEAAQLRRAMRADRATAAPRRWWRTLGSLPVRGLVAFYRTTVAPALGSRCLLTPSCSAYSLQAARERGWVSIPMTADRLIREPTVTHARAVPVTMPSGEILFADPITDHIGARKRHAPATCKGLDHD
ncbi:MAG: membrane protein insertion efficiency factor YidD [Verrucomicrobia bacterium]|nr:membrane protein insertion efficiency factor YidD [Verrucomicrobiota bacterium]